MKLYNANTSTLLESMKYGAAGYSGVMANFHPALYAWLLENWEKEPEKAGIFTGYTYTVFFHRTEKLSVKCKNISCERNRIFHQSTDQKKYSRLYQ